ncbi:hypothetical protein OPQ81_001874 [Rhizoctonia solani]|nr:hypothetical protein OPQ81_001874 [Rhizoctonia solani]
MRRGHGSTKVPNVKLRPAKKKTNQTQDYDDEPSYEPLRESLRNDASAKPFATMNICCSGVKDKQALLAKARELGATCSSDFTDLTTHLVADAPGSAKYKCAVELGIPVCTSDWINETHKRWLAGDDIDPEESVSAHLLPPLKGVVVCVTRLEDDTARDRLNKSSRRLGASYRSHMNREVTHLLIGPDGEDDVDNQKIQWVKRMNAKRREEQSEEPQIAIVWDVWLLMCAAAHARVPEEEFAYSESGKRPEPPADIEQILRRSSSRKPKKVYVTASNVGAATTINNATKEVLEKARVRKVVPKDAVWGSILSSRNQAEETSTPEVTFSSPKPQPPGDDSATEDDEEDSTKAHHIPPKPVEQAVDPPNRGNQSAVVSSSMVSRLNSLRGSAFQLGVGISDHAAPASGRTTSVSNLGQKLGGARNEGVPPPSSTTKVFSGKRIAPIGEACGTMLYDALRAHGAIVIETPDPKGKRKTGDSELSIPPEADFYIVRLASESAQQAAKLDSYHKFRTDCWVEHCIFEDRLCLPEENVTFAPLKTELPISGAELIKLHWTGLDNEQETAVKRLIKALGMASTETFAKRVNTHLLCPTRSGLKYDKASQWRVVVVGMEWLYDIAKEGRIPDADLTHAKLKLEQASSRMDGTTTEGPNRTGMTDLPALGNNPSLFGPSNGLLPTQRQSAESPAPPPLRSSGSGSTEIEVANGLPGYNHQGSAISMSGALPEQKGGIVQNSQVDRERKREAQRNQLANSLDALLKKHQREESTHSDQPRKRIRPIMRHKAADGTLGNGTGRTHSLTEQVSSLSISTHDPDYVSPLEAIQPANEETLQVHYQDPNQLAAKENLRRLLDGSSQVDGDIFNVDTQTESPDLVPAPVEPKRKRGGVTRRSQRKL